ncbi:uncharacterized protein LY79DRAFT_584234 [Colletotrichum navitas]|uniref:Uncharacterized protein n=1 Tax=Colletotrichum navitas TaxID=681940 RepID=A0AAD8PN25_9PEZI|nr:uncharacterized protein LY79DRAFT_584234 [Colletotrichum navitas]KAK1570158.1 hypothetical protein LY79DRAFT_584234 [Colletotrichum navitas]
MASESGDSFYASESSSTSQAEDSIINSSQISININITSNEFNSLLSYLNNSSPTVNYRGLTENLGFEYLNSAHTGLYIQEVFEENKLSYKDQEKVLKNNYSNIGKLKRLGKEFPVNSYKTKIPLFTNLSLALYTSKENQVDEEFY